MKSVSNIIDDATLNWLLEKNNPSVRYYALTKLLGYSSNNDEVIEAKNEIMISGLVPQILKQQHEAGNWGNEKKFYLEKYSGTVWQLIILAELSADPSDERIKKACNFILDNSQDKESFGFSINSSGNEKGGRHSEVIPCLTGNMVFSLIKLGFLNDDRVQKAIQWICKYQRTDDGEENIPQGWPYERFEICWGKHTCHMGVVKSLKALAAIPEEKRTDIVKNKISELVEYVLMHHIYKKSHNLEKVSKPGWLKLGFPLMYQSDVLEILYILADLGSRDNRMESAIEKVNAKQNTTKRWKLENTYNGKMLYDIEEKGESSKWVTLRAVDVLMQLQ